jgi:hypothetical protein
MVAGNVIFNQNLASTGGSVATTNAVDVSLQYNELYALRTASLSGEITIHKIHVNSGSAKSGVVIEDQMNNNIQGIKYYPNPATKQLQLESMNGNRMSSVELFNLQGSKVHSKYSLNNRKHTVILDELDAGMYIVTVKYNNGNFERFRITKK